MKCVEENVDLNQVLAGGHTPLCHACEKGNVVLCKCLLEHGADPSFCDPDGRSPLQFAVNAGSVSCVVELLSYGGDASVVEVKSGPCESLLREALQGRELVNLARLGNVEGVLNLAKLGPHVTNYRDHDGWSALHGACFSDSDQIVRILSRHGARVNSRTIHGYTPLIEAAATGKPKAVSALLGVGADVNVADEDGWTALHFACAEGHVEIVQMLINYGADVHAFAMDGKIPGDVTTSAQVSAVLQERAVEDARIRRDEASRLRAAKEQEFTDKHAERVGELASRMSKAEDLLSESLRENEVLRDTVVQMVEGLPQDLLDRMSRDAEKMEDSSEERHGGGGSLSTVTSASSSKNSDLPSNVVELRRIYSTCSASMTYLEELGHQVRSLSDSCLDEAFVQFSSIELPETPETLWTSPYSTVVGAKLMGKSVVVKRLQAEPAQGMYRAIFEDVAVFPSLRHPNLVTCLGVAFSPHPEVVFARVESGLSLHDLLHGPNTPDLSLRTKYRIIRGMCDGLSFLHLQTVVHRRFSSYHVVVGPDFEARLCGFAMSRSMSAVRGPKPEGQWRRWSAPETAASLLGQEASWSNSDKSDVFSFGMVCWELCSEIEPYGDVKSDREVLDRIVRGERPFTDDDFMSMVPSMFAPLLSACLALDPVMRPSFLSCQTYLKTVLSQLPASTVRIDENARRSFLRDLDLLMLALDRGQRFEPVSCLHAMELKARWQWAVQMRAEHVVERALEFGVPVSCKLIGGLDYDKLIRNNVSPSELFELDDLLREPSFCPVAFGPEGTEGTVVDPKERIVTEIFNDFGTEVGNEILRVFKELHNRSGSSRRVIHVAIDAASGRELTPTQILTYFSRIMRSSMNELLNKLPKDALTNEDAAAKFAVAESFRSQGKLLMAQGKYADAVSAFSAALKMEPQNMALYARRSAAYFACGLYMEALEDCKKALSASHLSWEIALKLRLADCCLKLGRLDEAVDVAKELLTDTTLDEEQTREVNTLLTSVNRVRTICKLGSFLLEKGRFQELLKHVTEGLTHCPTDDCLIVLQGFALLGLGEGGLAARSADVVLLRNRRSRGGWLVKGLAALEADGDLCAAVECFERAWHPSDDALESEATSSEPVILDQFVRTSSRRLSGPEEVGDVAMPLRAAFGVAEDAFRVHELLRSANALIDVDREGCIMDLEEAASRSPGSVAKAIMKAIQFAKSRSRA